MYTLYGIPNCDTVKKAKKYLDEKGIPYEFSNFKKEGPSIEELESWRNQMGPDFVNKRGRTYKQLASRLEKANDKEELKIIRENLSVIRRPILTKGSEVKLYGFDQSDYESFFNKSR